MAAWYGTFGLDSPYGNHYVVIEAADYQAAHTIMRAKFGNRWTRLVDEDQWTRRDYLGHTQAQKANLKRMELP